MVQAKGLLSAAAEVANEEIARRCDAAPDKNVHTQFCAVRASNGWCMTSPDRDVSWRSPLAVAAVVSGIFGVALPLYLAVVLVTFVGSFFDHSGRSMPADGPFGAIRRWCRRAARAGRRCGPGWRAVSSMRCRYTKRSVNSRRSVSAPISSRSRPVAAARDRSHERWYLATTSSIGSWTAAWNSQSASASQSTFAHRSDWPAKSTANQLSSTRARCSTRPAIEVAHTGVADATVWLTAATLATTPARYQSSMASSIWRSAAAWGAGRCRPVSTGSASPRSAADRSTQNSLPSGSASTAHPLPSGRPAAVDQRGAQADQPVHLSVAERVGHEVEVEPVLHRLGLGDGEEEQAGLATVGVDDHGFGVVGVLGVIDEPEHIGPEVGQEVGRPAVDGEVPDGAGGHVRELLVRREAPPPASM